MKKYFLMFLCFGFLMLFVESTVVGQTIAVTDPSGSSHWCIGQSYTITWTHVGTMDANVKITLYNSAGTTKIADVSDGTPNDGSFGPWTVPSVSPGLYVMRVKTLDNAVYDDSTPFHIENCPAATIEVNSPNGSSTWCKGHVCGSITWTRVGSMDANVKITLYNNTGTTKIADISDNTPNDGSFTGWAVPNSIADGNYIVRVKTLDNAVYDDSVLFKIESCGDDDPGIDWDRIRDKIRRIIEAEPIPWWRIKGPWPWPPDPDPCLSCEFEFGLDKIRNKLNELGLKNQIQVELFGQDGKLGDLGAFGAGKVLRNNFRGAKVSSRLQRQLKAGTGFKLVFKNMKGEIVHTQAVKIQEQVKQMR